MGTYQTFRKLALAGIAIVAIAGCSKSTQTASKQLATFDVNMYPLNKLVCDPMGGGNPENPGMGLKASLYYTSPGQTYPKVADYFENGIKSPQAMFFSEIFVPTRTFDKGFPTQTGGFVKDDSGNKLIEHFAIRFSTVLKLSQEDEEGEYEFAILSDDGAVMKTRIDGVDTVVVDNDNIHPTRMGCGTTKLNMTKESEFLVDFEYYQGPKYHISFIPLWRKVSSSNAAETECGKLGNDRYFDYNNNSAPKQPYKDILARGWKPIAAANYNLPISAVFNPCVEGVAPVISNFVVDDLSNGRVLVSWTTDIPATTQVRYVNMDSGVELLTNADNFLTTEHEMLLEGLNPGKWYLFQGVSISDSYGKSISDPVTLLLEGASH